MWGEYREGTETTLQMYGGLGLCGVNIGRGLRLLYSCMVLYRSVMTPCVTMNPCVTLYSYDPLCFIVQL